MSINNHISEQSFENDNKQTKNIINWNLHKNEEPDTKEKKGKLIKERKEDNKPEKIKKDEIYNEINNPNLNLNMNFNKFEQLKNKNYFDLKNSKISYHTYKLDNPKIKVRIEDIEDKNLNNFKEKAKGNQNEDFKFYSLNDNHGKNINININNKITNFYKMINVSNNNEDKNVKNKNFGNNEYEIQNKANSEMIKMFSQEKFKEKEKNHQA